MKPLGGVQIMAKKKSKVEQVAEAEWFGLCSGVVYFVSIPIVGVCTQSVFWAVMWPFWILGEVLFFWC